MRASDWANGFLHHIGDAVNRENMVDELRSFTQVLNEGEAFAFLRDRSIPFNDKLELLMVLKDEMDFRVLALICVLVRHSMITEIDELLSEIDKGLLREKGYTIVDVTISSPLDGETESNILNYIHGLLGDNVKVYYRIDRSIVGGFIIEFDGRMIDMSTRTRLSLLKQNVVGSRTDAIPEASIHSRRMAHVYKSIDDELTAFEDRIIEEKGQKVVRVILARPLDMDTKAFIEKNIEKLFNKEVFVRYYVDPSIIGGIVLQSENDRMMDLSITGRLNEFRNHIHEEVMTLD
ncbi:MAG: F0F1 ATP synthase subunit delta [Thermoanaerobacteraceae bacterium]|nr:F0F1 ATP synthase subunit delta [Thermoanaerobacteraceae bacterium]